MPDAKEDAPTPAGAPPSAHRARLGGFAAADVAARFKPRAICFADFVTARPGWLVVAALILASFLRSGIVVWNWFELSPGLLTNWDKPGNAFQSNLLFNALGTAWQGAGLDPTSLVWLLVQVGLSLLVFALVAVLLIRRFGLHDAYLPLAVFLASGLGAVLWREIGRYDALFIAGVCLAVLARRTWIAWVGVAIAALSSPEQLLVAAVLLVLLAVLPDFRDWLTVGLRLLAGAVAVLVAVQVWFTLEGNPFQTRIGVLFPFISGETISAATAYDPKQGFVKFTIEKAMVTLSAGPSLVWSFLGVATLFVLLFAVVQRGWIRALYLLLVVVAAPILVSTVVGEDRTRDLVLVVAPLLLVVIVVGSEVTRALVERLPGGSRTWLVWLAALATVIPLTYFYLYAEEPFRFVKELVIALNNGVPLEMDGGAR